MNLARHGLFTLATVITLTLPLAGCDIDVRGGGSGRKADVDVRTPVGAVSVRTDVKSPDTGLPVYPGGRPRRDAERAPESANVDIGTSWFGVKVVAAKYESDDAPEKILEFYRREMQTYGTVTECKGDVDFKGRKPVCKERLSSHDTQLLVGTEERQRVVSVKPRGSGAEFDVVYVQTRGQS
jgi:hypothetical protein